MTAMALLLLADGRYPAGGHAHSGGVEAAVIDGRVHDLASLEQFAIGRLLSTGLTEAALAAATLHRLLTAEPATSVDVLCELDGEADARIAPTPLREASRRLGRQLARVASRCWPHAVLVALAEAAPDGGHQPVVLGTVGLAAGLTVEEVAALSVHHAVTTATGAAVRLLGLDPFGVAALTAKLAPLADDVATRATDAAADPLAELPARTGPLLEIAATEHRARDARLFAT